MKKLMKENYFLSGMKCLQSLHPNREFDLNIYWSLLQDLSDGPVFFNAVVKISKEWKESYPPSVGVIRERYFTVKKSGQSQFPKLPEKRWSSQPPKEWTQLIKRFIS